MRRGIVILMLLLVAVAVYFYVAKTQGAAKVINYKTAPITMGNVTARVTATGSLQAVTKISVGSEVSGRVISLKVDFNSRVHKGQVLAELDPLTFQAQLEQQRAGLSDAQAAVDSSQANLQNLQTAIARGEAGILGAQAQIEAARAAFANNRSAVITAQANERRARITMANSQKQLGRQENLANRDLVARSDADTAQTTYLQDQASYTSLVSQVESAQASLRSAQATIEARQADLLAAISTRDGARAQAAAAAAQLRSASARVRTAQANVQQSELTLSKTFIRSPIDGTVLDRKVTIGQTVAAQFQAPDLFTLAENLNQMQVEVAVDEADIGQVKQGANVTYTVDAFPAQNFTGTVSEVRKAPINTQNVITYTVVVRTANPDLKLMPGMTATVGIEVGTHEDVMLVPNAALRFNPPASELAPEPSPTGTPGEGATPGDSPTPGEGRKREWGKGKEGGRRGGAKRTASKLYTIDPTTKKPVLHRVRLGLTDGTNTEIKSRDLKAGDEVITESPSANPSGSPTPSGGGGGKGGRRGGMF